ncbi:unnamed protein product [Vitrella brassicaformis CCMP3155]|uniref:protein-disulfide reductase n=1 Tax=Vitrella brassicaformis (strain CCMP3155) TaxID=1169540 RepID=A0A0G4FSJ4_VITBC|nr:unnamed protein product [Vitrella brassicaformis CCMP3155]|eukprot:CEM17404.1 unnamed protein product [Vitrella brassicaformis CCMP3155]
MSNVKSTSNVIIRAVRLKLLRVPSSQVEEKNMTMALVPLFGDHLIRGTTPVPTASLDADVIGIYFSAHWCPPCQIFTPQLAQVYMVAKTMEKSFEIVFVSSDRDASSFQHYFATMPWLAIPFDKPTRQVLKSRYGISGIPSLVLINGRDGSLINKEGRQQALQPNFVQGLPMGGGLDASVRGVDLEAALEALDSSGVGDEEKRIGLETIATVIRNVVNHPGEAKYRTLKKSNKSVQQKLGRPEFAQLLKVAGFREQQDSYTIPEANTRDTSHIKAVLDTLSCLIETLPQQQQEQEQLRQADDAPQPNADAAA